MSCCRRITIEDPVNVFRSDTGWISVYRSPGGVDIRLDDSPNPGAAVNADCDFMLVKLTYWGRDFPTTVGRACWAVAEFRIRGMSTSIFFLHAVLDDPNFQAGRLTTLFIDEWPQLLTLRASADRDTKIPQLSSRHRQPAGWLAIVNGVPTRQAARHRSASFTTDGSKQRLVGLVSQRFACWLRELAAVGVTDTTFSVTH